MRVMLKGEYKALRRNLILEGDDVVKESPDLIISPLPDDYKLDSIKVVGANFVFPHILVKAMGYDLGMDDPPGFLAFRWFDTDRWRDQIMVGFPLRTLMNDGLGVPDEAGMACRFTDDPTLDSMFRNEGLEQSLNESRHCGFVTLDVSPNMRVRNIQAGVPYRGFFNALEGVQGKITDWIVNEEVLLESWTTNLLLTRYPYPFKMEAGRVFLKNFSQEIERHFWLFDASGHRKSLYTDSTMIGVATSWSPTLTEACRRTIRTLNNICLPNKQFRTDLVKVAGEGWGQLAI